MRYVQRARDVRLLVNQHGVERGLIKAVERLSEDNEMIRQELQDIGKIINRMADIVANIATVGDKLKRDWEQVQQKFNPDKDMQ